MKTVLIAGASYGIGRAIFDELKETHEVVTISRNPFLDSGQHIIHDFSSNEPISITSKQLDGVVYCPGSINLKPFHRLSTEDFLQDYNINVLGAVRLLQASLPLLKKSPSPSVVLFSTVAVTQGMGFHSSIASAKGALEGLVRSLAAEWAPLHIRINAIAPSLTNTPLAKQLLSTPEKIEAAEKRHPLGKIGTPQDMSKMATFLLDSNNAWITGQIIHIDGGLSSLRM